MRRHFVVLYLLVLFSVTITYKGKASHAAIAPWKGINALDAAFMCYANVSCMRQQMRPDWRIHGIITKGGTKANIIPEETQMQYSLRAPTKPQLDVLIKQATGCFEAAATSTGYTVSIEWGDKPYENMLSNKLMEELYSANCQHLGEEVCTDPEVLAVPMGGTDMGNVSHVIPSIHPGFDIKPNSPHHTRLFREAAGTDFALEAGVTQAKVLAMTAIDIMCDPSLLHNIKDTFEQDIVNEARF